MNRAQEDALDIFRYALNASRVETAMERRVRFDGVELQIDGHNYSLDQYDRLLLISLGKAAGTLACTFLRQAGWQAERLEGIVVAPEAVALLSSRFRL